MVSDFSSIEGLELGRPGLMTFAGTIHEERLKQLSSPERRNSTYREMADNDPIVGAVLFVVDMLIRQLDWRVEPYSENGVASAEDIQAADFVWSCFNDMNRPFKEVVSEILSFLVYGWSWHELVFKRRQGDTEVDNLIIVDGQVVPNPNAQNAPPPSKHSDGRIGWHKIAGRAQETLHHWEFDEYGELLGMWQQAPPDFILRFIPLSKSLHFRTTSVRNNPEGRSILRNAYRPWYFKKTIEEIQAVGVERDLAGLPVMWVPEELMRSNLPPNLAALRGDLETMVRNIRRGHQEGMLAPRRAGGEKVYELELLSTAGRRSFDIKAIMEYYDQRITMMSLSDFVLMGHESVGSFALADSKTSVFSMATKTRIDTIADQFNTRAIPQLLRLNGMDSTRAPKLVHSDLESVDLNKLGRFIQALAYANATKVQQQQQVTGPDGETTSVGEGGKTLFEQIPDLLPRLLNEAGLPGGDNEDM